MGHQGDGVTVGVLNADGLLDVLCNEEFPVARRLCVRLRFSMVVNLEDRGTVQSKSVLPCTRSCLEQLVVG